MNNIFFADSDVGFKILQWVFSEYKQDVSCVVVTTTENDIYIFAQKNRIRTFLYSDIINNNIKNIDEFDYGFLIWWPYILPEHILDIASRGIINTHPSYLPYNRGKNYNFWAIVENAPFGVSLHFITKDIDSGDIIARNKLDYDWTDTGESLYYMAKSEMIKLFKEQYPLIRENKFTPITQDISHGSFHFGFEMHNASNINLDECYKARDLINLIRARTFSGFPACTFEDSEKKYEIRTIITEKRDEST